MSVVWCAAEMYRRILFVGALPLLSAKVSRRAGIGVGLALVSAIVYREVEPFQRDSTNVLVHVAQYSILLTFASALAIETDLAKGFNNFAFGLVLVVANLIILGLAFGFGIWRHHKDGQRLWRWQRLLTSHELRVVKYVMDGADEGNFSSGSDLGTTEMAEMGRGRSRTGSAGVRRDVLLKQYSIDHSEVSLIVRVGAGAFGEVFKGRCFSQEVAVKTVLKVTVDNMRTFKNEILLTAQLRHPSIVNFVGAVWSPEITCMVIEWVHNGPLTSMLSTSRGLRWDEPLLSLAMDIAKGMVYLHSKDYFDEVDGQYKMGVLHRDLKPDNVLVTKFLRAKIADFGSSRAMTEHKATSTVVGTPLFAAPEVMRGESYDEKVDVYSFSMMLLDMAAPAGLMSFIGAQWADETRSRGARSSPSQEDSLLQSIREMWRGGWRPVDEDNPSVPSAPPAVAALIAACAQHDPSKRPSFQAVLEALTGPVSAQVERITYIRGGPMVVRAKPGQLDTSEPSPLGAAAGSTGAGVSGAKGGLGEDEPSGGGKAKEITLTSSTLPRKGIGRIVGEAGDVRSRGISAPEVPDLAVLPPGWSQHVDATTGKTYFSHAASGAVQWRRPAAGTAAEGGAAGGGGHEQRKSAAVINQAMAFRPRAVTEIRSNPLVGRQKRNATSDASPEAESGAVEKVTCPNSK